MSHLVAHVAFYNAKFAHISFLQPLQLKQSLQAQHPCSLLILDGFKSLFAPPIILWFLFMLQAPHVLDQAHPVQLLISVINNDRRTCFIAYLLRHFQMSSLWSVLPAPRHTWLYFPLAVWLHCETWTPSGKCSVKAPHSYIRAFRGLNRFLH